MINLKQRLGLLEYLNKDLKHSVKSISHYIRTKLTPLDEKNQSKSKKIQIALKDLYQNKLLPKNSLVYEESGLIKFHKKIDVDKTFEKLIKSSNWLIRLLEEEKFYETNNYRYLLEYLAANKHQLKDKTKNQILFLACQNGNEELFQLALKLEPDFNAKKSFDNMVLTPLSTALMYGRDHIAASLLGNPQVDVNAEISGAFALGKIEQEGTEHK